LEHIIFSEKAAPFLLKLVSETPTNSSEGWQDGVLETEVLVEDVFEVPLDIGIVKAGNVLFENEVLVKDVFEVLLATEVVRVGNLLFENDVALCVDVAELFDVVQLNMLVLELL
jgi:hypothetical protein